jgi:hypothetical protein
MREISREENSPIPLGYLHDYLIRILSDCSIDIVIFGSTAKNNILKPNSDVDIWLSGDQATEEEASKLLIEDQRTTHYPYHIIKASDYAEWPELELAIKFELATTGIAVTGNLPPLPEGYTANNADIAFARAALQQASDLIYRADVDAKAGVWTDGSLAREALRLWLFAQSSKTDRDTLKALTDHELIERLTDFDAHLAEIIKAETWNSAMTIQIAQEVIDGSIDSGIKPN